ncbi:hypothetical protein VM1G_11856 [Cytospora mali]|uniref:Uncharacterized protein n=1 Tax=Cytospora mali TaxID=578113 RepID=A0A194W9I4_CYTMA|nr:hypothetical protein VM1G_11856 [Valsa mali]
MDAETLNEYWSTNSHPRMSTTSMHRRVQVFHTKEPLLHQTTEKQELPRRQHLQTIQLQPEETQELLLWHPYLEEEARLYNPQGLRNSTGSQITSSKPFSSKPASRKPLSKYPACSNTIQGKLYSSKQAGRKPTGSKLTGSKHINREATGSKTTTGKLANSESTGSWKLSRNNPITGNYATANTPGGNRPIVNLPAAGNYPAVNPPLETQPAQSQSAGAQPAGFQVRLADYPNIATGTGQVAIRMQRVLPYRALAGPPPLPDGYYYGRLLRLPEGYPQAASAPGSRLAQLVHIEPLTDGQRPHIFYRLDPPRRAPLEPYRWAGQELDEPMLTIAFPDLWPIMPS